jgi:SAM-dependent methyltransferase/acyl carrier protein
VVNHYGPTENTVVATFAVAEPGGDAAPPIGKPISNVRVYVLGPDAATAPAGLAGELCIAGDSLAAGYHNLPDLTAEKFVPNPFAGAAGERLYRSGDRVRYRADGNIEFLGRIDTQVKLRGFRVEPGEVESVLAQHPAVRESIVVAHEEPPGDPRLVAYVLEQSGESISAGASGAAWESEQVGRWMRLYDETYARAEPEDSRFNITGWNSSYTGEPLLAEDMREQVEATVSRIRQSRPRRVLEIGCGTGLLLFRLAADCQQYHATDFSAAAVAQVKAQLGPLPQVTLRQAAADDFSGLEAGSFDLVVLNSVIQYFPGTEYLERVLRGAVNVVRAGGHVFIGDVRSLALWESFHASVELESAGAEARREEVQERVRRRLWQEPELVVDPEFFTGLAARMPDITGVETQLRRGWLKNELTGFRYDVWLEVRGAGAQPAAPKEITWDRVGNLPALWAQLCDRQHDALVVRGVPNARVVEAVEASAWLHMESEAATVAAWRQQWAQAGLAGTEPEAIWQMADELGYEAHVGWGETAGAVDVLFLKPQPGASRLAAGWQRVKPGSRSLREFTNDPRRGETGQRLIPVLREYLRERLPDYMLPSAFVMLDVLPLTPNGKVDRKNLPSPSGRPATLAQGFVEPRNDVEKQIARVWQELLGIDVVGVHDNFFDIGGHSLLLMRVQGRLSETLKGDLSMVDLLRYPTVASLASFVAAESEQAAEPPLMTAPANR